MKTLSAKAKISGLTLIELLVVIFVIAILVAMLLPAFAPRKSGYQIQCLSNQHQIAIGLIIFEDDHNGKFPAQVSMTNGGSLEYAAIGPVSSHFQTLAPYLGKNPNLLICSTDKTRHAATNFSKLKNENISYFLNLDAITNMNSILSGDRHLEFNGKPVNAGVFVETTNAPLNWSEGFHGTYDKPWGCISFGDGHAQSFVRTEGFNLYLHEQPFATNRFCFP